MCEQISCEAFHIFQIFSIIDNIVQNCDDKKPLDASLVKFLCLCIDGTQQEPKNVYSLCPLNEEIK